MMAAALGERDADRIVEGQLNERLRRVESAAGADALAYFGPIYPMAGEMIKDAIEALPEKRDEVLFILDTSGGLIDIAERIAIILRHHYERVAFFVPGEAMSAGTILVMSGDSIHMDYASMLGPIDPQIETDAGKWVPRSGLPGAIRAPDREIRRRATDRRRAELSNRGVPKHESHRGDAEGARPGNRQEAQ